MRNKSIKLNMLLNALNGLMKVVFPLITFPYTSKILGVEGVGQYSFSASIVAYFSLFAGLGIETYAIREGAKFRENREKLRVFASEVFSINVFSSLIAYSALFCVLMFARSLQPYRLIILVISLQIAFNTIGVEWILQMQEEFAFITVRSFIFQVLSLCALFVFVRDSNDVIVYALIAACSAAGSKLLNYFRVKKYCDIYFTKNINWKCHLKPILLMFSTSIAITIYVQSDTTILGLLHGNNAVGLYSVSNRIYNVVKSIMSSVVIVSIPRLALYYGTKNYREFNRTASDIYRTLISVVLPATTGMILLRREIILIISTEEFLKATTSFSVLSVTLIVCMVAWFWAQCILVPMGYEKDVFYATLVSAIANIALNLVLIPTWAENAAAFTTLLAQALELVWCFIIGRKKVQLELIANTMIKSIIGCAGIIACCLLLRLWLHGTLFVVFAIASSIVVYFLLEIIMDNTAITELIKNRFKKKMEV